jgi:RNA polymerase sigma-70 factor (ECF subfamily)
MQGDENQAPEPIVHSQELTEEFLRLLTEHDRTLAIYVTGLVQPLQDAQDILQEGKIVMWRHFGKFKSGTNFVAWGRKILLRQILAYRRKMKHRRHGQLNEDIMVMLDAEMDSAIREKRWVKREQALRECLRKLKPEQRELIEQRYRDEASIEKISRQTDKTETAVYQLLYRIRKALQDCVQLTLNEAETKPTS